MGLFIGGSIITVLELFDVIIMYFVKRCMSNPHPDPPTNSHEGVGRENGTRLSSNVSLVTVI